MFANILSNRNVILISCAIFITGIGLTMLAGNLFDKAITEIDKDYDKALKFTKENAEEFPYSVKTEQGNLYATGEVKAVGELIHHDELPEEYMAIREVKEEYREHRETYSCNCHTVNNRTSCSTCTRTYWSWDYAGSNTEKVDKISLLGQEMASTMIPWDTSYVIEQLKSGDRYLETGARKRSYFEVIKPGVSGSFGFTSDQDGFRHNAEIAPGKSDTLKVIKTVTQVILGVVSIGLAFAFAYYNYESFNDRYI